MDKDIAGGREVRGQSEVSCPVLLSSSAELQDLGDSKLEFSVWVIVKIYLSK